MPTNKTVSQVSVNIDLGDKAEGKGDFEMVDLMPQMHLNTWEAARFDTLTVESSNINDSLWVYKGKRRYPSCWFFLWIFGPVLLLSVLTPTPFAAFRSHYKNIQTWPVSTCYISNMDYNPSDLYLRVTATYQDKLDIPHKAEFFYNMGYDMDVDNYLLDFYEMHMSFPCYHDGAMFYDTGFPSYVISYAKDSAWRVTTGLVGCWIAILILTSLALLVPWCLDHNKRVISRSVFEKTGEPFMDVQDWGSVDPHLKQVMYSVVYASCIQETEQAVRKGVKFITFTRHTATSLLSTSIFGFFTFLFLASMIVMMAFAFHEKEHVFLVMMMWCLVSIVAIVPAILLFLIRYTIRNHPYINATAVVTPITATGEAPETVSIFGKFYPHQKLGYMLKGNVRRA